MTALLMRWQVIPVNFVVFCNRSDFCHPSRSYATEGKNSNSTHIFYPFAIETAGTWREMAIELTQEIGSRMTTITEDTRETTFLFQRLSMALQRVNAVSFHNTMVTE